MAKLPPEDQLTVANDPEGADLADILERELSKDDEVEADLEDFDQDEDEEDYALDAKVTVEDTIEGEAEPVEEGLGEPADYLEDDSDEEAETDD